MLATSWRTPVSMLAGSAFAVISFGVWLVGWLAAGFTCDDTCSDEVRPGEDWSESSGAMQWSEIAGLSHVILLLTLVAIVLVKVGRRRAALAAILAYVAVSARLGLLINTAHHDTFLLNWSTMATAAGLIMVIASRAPWGEGLFPARDDARTGALPLAAELTGALFLGWLISRLVSNAVTIGPRMELAGYTLSAAEPIQFYSWIAAGLCALVLIAAAVHVVTHRPSRAALRLGAVAGALAALGVAQLTPAAL